MNTKKVAVKSMVNYTVSLYIPDLRFNRIFTTEGEQKSIDFDVLYEGLSMSGVRTLFDEGILYIENKEDRIALGLQEENEPERFKVLSRNQILKLLKVDNVDKLKETISTLPKEQVNKIAEIAIQEKYTDFEKCQVLKDACGIDVISNVQFMVEDSEK